MAARNIVDDSPPTKHSVRVDWFRREPGGSTIFVVPAAEVGAAPRGHLRSVEEKMAVMISDL